MMRETLRQLWWVADSRFGSRPRQAMSGVGRAAAQRARLLISRGHRSLLEIAREVPGVLDEVSPDMLGAIDAAVAAQPGKQVAVFADRQLPTLPTLLVARWHEARIVVIGDENASLEPIGPPDHGPVVVVAAATASDRHALLTAYGPFAAIIDITSSSDQDRHARLRNTFFHLATGGSYFLPRAVDPAVECPENLGTVITGDRFRQITSTSRSLPVTRYEQIDQVLSRRRPSPGAVLSTLPAITFESRSELAMNRRPAQQQMATTFRVPSLSLREYDDVRCAPHQVLILDGIVLPDSYRHYTRKRMHNHFLTEQGEYFTRYPKSLSAPGRLRGQYFYLGSEFTQHFGHAITEQLSRLWAWSEAKERYPGLKALVSMRGRFDQLQPFETSIFGAAGIASEDLVAVKGVVRVERLLAAAPMLVNPTYIHPDIARIWRRVGGALLAGHPHRDYPRKIFISRMPSRTKRGCHNYREVEQRFVRNGFTVIYPEDFALPEQVMMFDRAEVIAGFAGSGLFNLALCPDPKQLIVISSESYTARNEYLISSVLGHRMNIIWCPSDADDIRSDFSFDFDRDGNYLDHLLRDG